MSYIRTFVEFALSCKIFLLFFFSLSLPVALRNRCFFRASASSSPEVLLAQRDMVLSSSLGYRTEQPAGRGCARGTHTLSHSHLQTTGVKL